MQINESNQRGPASLIGEVPQVDVSPLVSKSPLVGKRWKGSRIPARSTQKHASVTIDTRTYDNAGRMTASTYNNGVAETRNYGTDNSLIAINFRGTGISIGNLAYGWDVNKNKTSEAVSGTMSNYGFTIPTSGYDNEDRLVSYNRTSGLSQSWGLSLVGDWNSVTTNGTSQTRTHGPTHELLTAASQSVSTDVKGNITLIPAVLRTNA